MKYSGIVFDLYNTLVFIADKRHCYRKFLEYYDVRSHQNLVTIMTTSHYSFEELAESLSLSKKDFSEYEKMLQAELDSVKLYPETITVLEKLKHKKLSVISNLATPYCKPFFDLGLHRFVDDWVFSCEVGVKKPDKHIYQIIQNKWEIDDILMVGDSLPCDVLGPQKIGFDALLLDRNHRYKQHSTISSLLELIDI